MGGKICYSLAMSRHPLEIHVHGDIALKPKVGASVLDEALRPLLRYAGTRSLADGYHSLYDDEPGIQVDAKQRSLHICWTVAGDVDFRQVMEEVCMGLNDIADEGAALEVTFYDIEFNEDEERDDFDNSRDDFIMYFVGPTPAAIMQVQRDMLVQDVVGLMERHFDSSELGGVIGEVDKLFTQRFDNLVDSLEIDRLPRSMSPGRNGNRKRHLH